MKSLLISLIISIPCNAFTQQIQKPAYHPSDSLKKILIEKIYDLTNAWSKSDTVTLSKYLTTGYRHIDVFGQIQHKNEWLAFASGKRNVADLKIYDVEILMYTHYIAAITGKMNYLFGLERTEQEMRFTQILIKHGTEWQRALFQATYVKK
jgi:hypothetical protein